MAPGTLLLALLGVCVASVAASDPFFKKYAFSKVMSSCVGEELYYGWKKRVGEATKACLTHTPTSPMINSMQGGLDFSRLHGASSGGQTIYVPLVLPGSGGSLSAAFPTPYNNFPFQRRQIRSTPLYDAEWIGKMAKKAESHINNFTCVLQTLGYMKNDLSMDFVYMEQELRSMMANLAPDLREDFIKGQNHCKDFTTCLPLDQAELPVPAEIKRAMAFVKCDKKTRMKICMKHDLKRHLAEFDVSGIMGSGVTNEDQAAMKLLHVLWGVEAKDDLKLY